METISTISTISTSNNIHSNIKKKNISHELITWMINNRKNNHQKKKNIGRRTISKDTLLDRMTKMMKMTKRKRERES